MSRGEQALHPSQAARHSTGPPARPRQGPGDGQRPRALPGAPPADQSFDQPATVNFQGTVIAFARVTEAPSGLQHPPAALQTDIYYNVMTPGSGSAPDDAGWNGWTRLQLPNQVRPSGMQLINVPPEYSATDQLDGLADAREPFRVLTNQEYVYLLRQAVGGTLLVNRLRLVRQVSPEDPRAVEWVLQPAWEVRFQHSGKPDVPRDDRDVQSYRSPDKEPFVEPALELPVGDVTAGRFDAALLPRDGDLLMCTVAVRVDDRIDLYEIPLDEDGRFLLSGDDLGDDRLTPGVSFALRNGAGEPLSLSGRPALLFFLKQERVLQGRDTDATGGGQSSETAEGSFLVQRAGRLLLATAVRRGDGPVTLATVELAIATDGTVARAADPLTLDAVGPAPYALAFAGRSHVTLPDIVVTEGFAFDLWIYPESDATPQLLVGNPDDDAAPRLTLVDGSGLELSFRDPDGNALTATTGSDVVHQAAWSHVQADFDPARPQGGRFHLRVNGDLLTHREEGSGTTPAGAPVTHLGAATEGFVGEVDSLAIYDAAAYDQGSLVGAWPLDTVTYAGADGRDLDPPRTPNTVHPDRPGLVHGARLLPSTSPAATGNGGSLTFDPRGLTILASYFEDLDTFGELNSSPALLASADGLIHCYFQGRDNRLSVLQRDVEAARAVFGATWTTEDTTPRPASPQTGTFQLVATQAGAFMNEATVTVTDPAAGPRKWFCDVVLTSPSGRTETWRGVPRSLLPFAATVNGTAVTDPNDPHVLTGAAPYYDASGTRPAAYLALPGNPDAALAGFASREVDGFPLASVAISPTTDELVTLTIVHHVPRWGDGARLTQTWRDVPARADQALQVLEGRSPSYPYTYDSDPPVDVSSYSVSAQPQAGSANRVTFFTAPAPTVDDAQRIVVSDGGAPNLCDVEIELTMAGEQATATWRDVDRRQGRFARIIQGTAPATEYDYAVLASGEYHEIGQALVVTTDGNSAPVGNVDRSAPPGGALAADDDLRVCASLFEAFVTAPVTPGDKLPPTGTPVTALAFQGAASVIGDRDPVPITGGSLLFGAHLDDLPDSGSVALVLNTSGFTGGTAVLARQGVNGGWRNQPPQRTLTFAPGGYVEFPTDEAEAPNIGALTIPGDMSVELWCHPARSSRDPFQPNQRLLTFQRTPPPDVGGDRVRYLAGLRDVPSLKAAAATSVRSAYQTTAGTLVAWFSPLGTGGTVQPGTVMTLAPVGVVEPTITVAVDGDQRIRATFELDPDTTPIVGTQPVALDEWYQVVLPWSVTRTYQQGRYIYDFTAALYVDGAPAGSRNWQATLDSVQQWATMTVGDPDPQHAGTLPMLANEVAFFARTLGAAEIGRYSQQRIPSDAPELIWRWMLLEGTGDLAVNSAPTGDGFSPRVTPSATWSKHGLYQVPTFGHGDHIASLDQDPIIRGWSHLAMVHQAGHAIDLGGDDYANCGNGPSTELGDTFSIEAWCEPLPGRQNPPTMTLLGKGEDYSLWLDAGLRPRFSVKVEIAGRHETLTLIGSNPLPPGVAAYLVATYELRAVETDGGDRAVEPRYEVRTALWVNGQQAARGVCGGSRQCRDGDSYQQFDDVVVVATSDADLNLGRSSVDGGTSYFRGKLSDVRLWTRPLGADEVGIAYSSRRLPGSRDGLVSWWRFGEADGRTAFDAQGDDDARLSRGDLRVIYPPTSADDFYVNGRRATPRWLSGPSSVGGYPTGDTFELAQVAAPNQTIGMYGQLDTVRIWATQLTGEQIADSMHRPSTGTGKGLAGAWNFDDGSGSAVEDATGRGNSAHRAGSPTPRWAVSTAPLSDEAGAVLNVLGGVRSFHQVLVTETPAVVEYADLQLDAYGDRFSVMKRAYLYVDDGTMHLGTGYKVGDLETVYLGQAQSQPSVIGYVEGSPPVPSENQTMPHWTRGAFFTNAYGSASSVSFGEADETTYSFNASRLLGSNLALTSSRALVMDFELKKSAGIGVEVQTVLVKLQADAGLVLNTENGTSGKEGVDRSSGTSVSKLTTLAPAGSWEPGDTPSDWVNPTVGRRYVPDNVGMALVKSRTVDVYASILASTRTTVKVSYAPNPDIPEDVNVLTFPIDPRYVKNGTLDGKVGLQNDPDHPAADLKRGSYFKPVEAYALKRRIERQQARLAGYYSQFDQTRQAAQIREEDAWETYRSGQRVNDAYDWAAHLSKRNIVNTYVWTADGGTYAEQTSTMNVYSESYAAASTKAFQIGFTGSIKGLFPSVGLSTELDAISTSSTSIDVVRGQSSSAAFSLDATVDPDAYLSAPDLDSQPIQLDSQPTEGKVDAYRYMTFFLAPSTANFAELFSMVIDQEWLQTSRESSAVALREATSATNGAWRVLHRVTFVSRIPPPFQPVPDQTLAPDIDPPANLDHNALLVALVKQAVGERDPDPSPVDIGTAISTVVGTPDRPGRLADLLPWWPQFLRDSLDYRLPAARVLRAFREDLLRYMIATYAAEEASRHA